MGTTLADRLREAMKARGFKRQIALDKAIAEELRVPYNPGWTHDILTGQTTAPRGPRLMAACKVLGIRERWLMLGDGPRDLEPNDEPHTYAEVPGWAEAIEEPAVAAMPRWVVEAVGRAPVLVRPERMTAVIVVQAVALWLASASEEERKAAAHGEEERRRGRGSRS